MKKIVEKQKQHKQQELKKTKVTKQYFDEDMIEIFSTSYKTEQAG